MAGVVQHSIKVISGASRFEPGMQESDLMDQLPDGTSTNDEGTKHIMLVSLGCFCGPKLAFKNIGRGAETLPFDWMRTRHKGLIHFLRNSWDASVNYNEFFEFNSKKVVPGCNMTTYRSFYHSFWHDDPTDPGMHERYQRRIKRFNEIDANSRPVLFVRTIPTTDELHDLPELLELLMTRHGRQACLLLIIDFQSTVTGPATVNGFENLLVYYLAGSSNVDEEGLPAPPYGGPIHLALDWIIGRPIEAMQFVSIEKIFECADKTHWGLNGLGGLWAFEDSPDGPEEECLTSNLPDPLPCLPALSSKELQQLFQPKGPNLDAKTGGVAVVPLGCSGLTKKALLEMGLAPLELPFDWLQITDAGLLHFLRKGFEAPIRDGLGAGNQRLNEKRGFFDFTTRKRVPNSRLMMCRSHLHSFWHDDPADPEVRNMFDQQFDLFNSLGLGGETILFVRAVATHMEVSRADEVVAALKKKFGNQVALLLIVNFQTEAFGAHVAENCEDLMVYFLGSDAHEQPEPYREPIETALDWLQGNEVKAACVDDVKALQALTTPTLWGLMGLHGLLAFNGITRKRDETDNSDREPSPEDWNFATL